MAYRKPNAYAKFQKSASQVTNAGETRTLAIIGTGAQYYTVYNEAIKKNAHKPYDKLSHENVFDILSVSSKPKYANRNTPNNTNFIVDQTFTINGNKIYWNILEDAPASVSVFSQASEGSMGFKQNIEVVIDTDYEHLVEDGEY